MNLLHLQYFYEIAKAGQISAASKKLRISQPAVSKQLRLLEDYLGEKLLERTPKRIYLTSAGKITFEHASRIFAESESLQTKLKTQSRELQGEWCLGASDNIGIHLAPKWLTKLKQLHPKLRVQLFVGTSTDIKEEILKDKCDLGLFYTPIKANEPFEVKEFQEVEFWVVIAAKNQWLDSKKKKITLDDVLKAKVPRVESRHKDYTRGFPAHFHAMKMGIKEYPSIEVNNHEAKKQFILQGAGYAFLTSHTVEVDVRAGKLIRIETAKPLLSTIYWATKKNKAPHRANEELLKLTQQRHKKEGRTF